MVCSAAIARFSLSYFTSNFDYEYVGKNYDQPPDCFRMHGNLKQCTFSGTRNIKLGYLALCSDSGWADMASNGSLVPH